MGDASYMFWIRFCVYMRNFIKKCATVDGELCRDIMEFYNRFGWKIPKNIGALIEHPGLIREYSGHANLKFLAEITGKLDMEKLSKLMESVGLDPKSGKKVSRYSLGMQQRLGIAQAIMDAPDILILDEPTNGLDNRGVDWFRGMLGRFFKVKMV